MYPKPVDCPVKYWKHVSAVPIDPIGVSIFSNSVCMTDKSTCFQLKAAAEPADPDVQDDHDDVKVAASPRNIDRLLRDNRKAHLVWHLFTSLEVIWWLGQDSVLGVSLTQLEVEIVHYMAILVAIRSNCMDGTMGFRVPRIDCRLGHQGHPSG